MCIVLLFLKCVLVFVNMYMMLFFVCIFFMLDFNFLSNLLFGVIMMIGILLFINVNGLCLSLFEVYVLVWIYEIFLSLSVFFIVIGYWVLCFRNKLWCLLVNFLVSDLIVFVVFSVFLILLGSVLIVVVIVWVLLLDKLLNLFNVSVSIRKVVSWVVNVLVDVILILVLVRVINVRLDLCIRDDFGIL